MLLENVRVVLVEPVAAGNVGAAARAMKNMGFSDLVVVGMRGLAYSQMKAMAVHAGDLIDAMRKVESLEEALSDCGRVLGTSQRNTRYRRACRSPREVAGEIVRSAGQNRVALVFGPEDRGLSNDEIRYCHEMIRIPVSDAYPSLNLAQAVMICCYELAQAAADLPAGSLDGSKRGRKLALAAEIVRMFESLKESLLAIGFLNQENPEHLMFAIRRMLTRRELEDQEVRILLGIARQISWAARVAAGARKGN